MQPLAPASPGRTASAPPGSMAQMAAASPFASHSVSPELLQTSHPNLAEHDRYALLSRVAL